MKKFTRYFAAAILTMAILLVWNSGLAQDQGDDSPKTGQQHGRAFVDENGDGFNDNAPDHDGDGIPNGQDPDYSRSGLGRGRGFIDADGDGINDYAQDADGDGIPNGRDDDYVRPMDGSGRKAWHKYQHGRLGNGFGRYGDCSGFGGGNRRMTGSGGLRRGRGK